MEQIDNEMVERVYEDERMQHVLCEKFERERMLALFGSLVAGCFAGLAIGLSIVCLMF